MSMQKRLKLSKKRQALAAEYVGLASMLARFFLQNRPGWQKSVLLPDLEGEGFLALTKAARTYDQSRLPYPKAYFARAIMNAMYKHIRKATRQPAEWKVSLQEAEELLPILENPNYLRLGSRIVLIDHEQAFRHVDSPGVPAFSLGMLEVDPLFRHVSFPWLELTADFEPFFRRLSGLRDDQINGYFDGVPREWCDSRSDSLKRYLFWARDYSEMLSQHLASFVRR